MHLLHEHSPQGALRAQGRQGGGVAILRKGVGAVPGGKRQLAAATKTGLLRPRPEIGARERVRRTGCNARRGGGGDGVTAGLRPRIRQHAQVDAQRRPCGLCGRINELREGLELVPDCGRASASRPKLIPSAAPADWLLQNIAVTAVAGSGLSGMRLRIRAFAATPRLMPSTCAMACE